jgi:hypothetical protein
MLAIAALALIKDWFDLDSLKLSDYWKETNSWPFLGRTIIVVRPVSIFLF